MPERRSPVGNLQNPIQPPNPSPAHHLPKRPDAFPQYQQPANTKRPVLENTHPPDHHCELVLIIVVSRYVVDFAQQPAHYYGICFYPAEDGGRDIVDVVDEMQQSEEIVYGGCGDNVAPQRQTQRRRDRTIFPSVFVVVVDMLMPTACRRLGPGRERRVFSTNTVSFSETLLGIEIGWLCCTE